MSPLLTARPSVSVTLRLVGACVVTALAAATVAFTGHDGRSSAAAPACLAVGCVCAALVAHMLNASWKANDDGRLAWMCAGVTVALIGLVTTLFTSPAVFPNGSSIFSQSGDAAATRYLIIHLALVVAGALAIAGVSPRPRSLLIFGGLGFLLLAWAAVDSSPVGGVPTVDGIGIGARSALGLLVLAQLAVAALWWRRSSGAPTWVETCVLALMALGALDMLAYLSADEQFAGLWWASIALRAGQFAVPAVGLLIGFIAVSEKLREFEAELTQNLMAERERAERQQELISLDQHRRDRIRQRMQRLIDGEGMNVAFQPIVDLASGQVVGAEALARFTAPDGEKIPTERCFLDAHAVDMGIELELAVIRRALDNHARLPQGRYLALNVSPNVLEHDDLVLEIARRDLERPLVVELTEHQPVEDYVALGASLARLRELGLRVAVDDVGSGFASFRHVTRVNPDILKLDRTLVCGIDDDPVRQSLASAIVSFARDVGATVVSEGIESESELCCLKGLAVGCGQGFYLARPNLGAIDAEVPQLTAVA
jgi:EAL domain-containing protein (putative c-di-GMP-specific phosphodiesterase class I)